MASGEKAWFGVLFHVLLVLDWEVMNIRESIENLHRMGAVEGKDSWSDVL